MPTPAGWRRPACSDPLLNPHPSLLLDEVGSTSDWVRANRLALADGQWVLAKRQTAGRGRMGRAWQAPAGNFMGSARIVPGPGEAPIHLLSFVAALALHDVCATLIPPDRLTLKWPNDLLLDGGKLSGILLEAEAGDVVLGIGVNLRHAPDVPGRRTMSLIQAAGDAPAPELFGDMLAVALAARRQQWRDAGFAAIRRQWLARAHPVGESLTVMRNGVAQQGRFGGLADDGALLLDSAEGRQQIHAAEVFALSEQKSGEESPDAARD